MTLLRVAIPFIFITWWAGHASAQGTSVASAAPLSAWGLGVSAAAVQQPYRGVDRKTTGLPLVSYEGTRVSLAGPRADLKLYAAGSVSLRLRARYALDGYDADDSPFLEGMEDRKGSVWLGAAALWHTDMVNLSGELLGDAMGNSKGMRLKLQADRRFQAGAFGFTPRVAVERLDGKYVDYYYGVRSAEVRANRAGYEGKATTNLEIGISADYSLSPKHNLFIDIGATRFGKGIKESTLLDRTGQTTLSAGYIYRF